MRSVTFQNNGPIVTTTMVSTTKLDRSCTDVVCLVLYLILVVACVTVAVGGIQKNEFHNKPFDIDHNPCYGKYRYLYIPSLYSQASVCVSFCPASAGVALDCQPNSAFPMCPFSISGLIRNEMHKVCHVMGLKAPKQNPMKTALNLILNFKDTIIEAGIYAMCISLILLVLVNLSPELFGCIILVLFELILIALSLVCLYRYFAR